MDSTFIDETIFSCDNSLYQYWQSKCLAWTFTDVKQSGSLVRLLSVKNDRPRDIPEGLSTFITKTYSPNEKTGDDFACYNKCGSVRDWIQTLPTQEESTVLLIDPDCVFLRPLRETTISGEIIAQDVSYMNPHEPKWKPVIDRHCKKNKDLLAAAGIPIVIKRSDLRRVSARWLAKTEDIRNDALTKSLTGWLAEMWGWTIVCAEEGLRHKTKNLCQVPTEDRIDSPLIHYCYSSEDKMDLSLTKDIINLGINYQYTHLEYQKQQKL